MGLSRDRAEAYLRRVAEAGLSPAAASPQAAAAAALYGLPWYQRQAIALRYYAGLPEDATARTIGLSLGTLRAFTAAGLAALRTALAADTGPAAAAAQVLTAVGALEDGVARQILGDLALALAVRRPGPAGRARPDPGSLLMSSAAHLPLAMLMNGRPGAAAPPPPGPGAAPARVVPVGQMVPVRGEGQGIRGDMQDVTGEMYVLSYAQTAAGARLTIAARTRGEFVPPGIEPSCRYRPYTTFPVHQFTATDSQGTRYQLGFRGRGECPSELTGQITLQPDPSPGIRWLDLVTVPGEPAVRIDLNRPPEAETTVRPPSVSLGEHVLNTIAMRLLLLVLEFPEEIRLHPAVPLPEPFTAVADGLGGAVAALEACGALSPLSPVPGQLAALCASLDVTGHGITAPPARRLPEPWLSMLAQHHRRKPRPAPDSGGCAAVAAAFPELDGITLTLTGLHHSAGRTVLLGQAGGLIPDGYEGRRGTEPDFPLRTWVRDSGGCWHAVRARGWAGADHGEVTMRLEVLPALDRDVAWIDVLAAGRSAQALLTLPTRWL